MPITLHIWAWQTTNFKSVLITLHICALEIINYVMLPSYTVRSVVQDVLKSSQPLMLRILDLRPCVRKVVKDGMNRHHLITTGVVLWCLRCGAYSSKRTHRLREGCKGPGSVARDRQRQSLLRGLHPLTGTPLTLCTDSLRRYFKAKPCACPCCFVARATPLSGGV